MTNFKDWMVDHNEFTGFPNPIHVREMLEEAKIITQAQNKLLPDSGGNPLIPYGNYKQVVKPGTKKDSISGFLRDQPPLRDYALANPENLASVIIFVLLTIRADFQQVMQDFPTIMAILNHKFSNPSQAVTRDQIAGSIDDLQTKLSQKVNPKVLDKEGFAKGYGLKSTAFGFKNDGIAETWTDREQMYNEIKGYADKNDTVGMFRYLTRKVNGLAPVKAGFVVQLITGKLGCIDMHNINLYSQYAKHYKKGKLYSDLDPALYTAKSDKAMDHYLRVLDQLESEGANTTKLWDIWVNYVAQNYTSKATGRSAYDTTGKFSGYSVGEDDPLYQKLQDIGDVPDRSGGKDTIFNPRGRSKAGLAASLGHASIYQIRDKQYWYDLLAAAENPLKTPDPIRVRNPGAKEFPAKSLAYLVMEPEMAYSIGLDDDFIRRAREVLEKRGILVGPKFRELGSAGQKVLWTPDAKGDTHVPQRVKAVPKTDQTIKPSSIVKQGSLFDNL